MDHYRVKAFREKLENLSMSDYHGLNSPGLTCYLNSVLQVLFMTEDFREAVKSSKSSATIDPYLGQLFDSLEREKSKTHRITQMLGITDVYEQRDAAEYFEKILCQTSPEASKIFRGELNHTTTCHKCNESSDSKSFFWVLPLAMDVSNPDTYSVQKGLQRFFKAQKVCGDNQMYCDSCKDKQDADIKCKMTQSPDVLTLLLKRFTFDYKKNCYIKLHCRADVVKSLCIENCRYDLYAVVHHLGNLTGGHYTADIKSFETGQWYCFDDSIVKSVKQQPWRVEDSSLRLCTAYLLMYRKMSGQPKKTYESNLAARSDVEAEERRDEAEQGDGLVSDHRLKSESCRGEDNNLLNGETSICKCKDLGERSDRMAALVWQQRNMLHQTDTGADGQQCVLYNGETPMVHLRTNHVERMFEQNQPPNNRLCEKQGERKCLSPGLNPIRTTVKAEQTSVVNSHREVGAHVGQPGITIDSQRAVRVSNVRSSRYSSVSGHSQSRHRANEVSKCNGFPDECIKSSNLRGNKEKAPHNVTADNSYKLEGAQDMKTVNIKERKIVKTYENKERQNPWK